MASTKVLVWGTRSSLQFTALEGRIRLPVSLRSSDLSFVSHAGTTAPSPLFFLMSNTPTAVNMTSNPRYSALEHGGLEVPEIPNAPEVVPGSKPPLDRRSSLNQPETLHPGQYEVNQEDHGNYYAGQEGKPAVTAPSYSDESRPAYITQEEKNIGVGVEAHQIQPRGNRRYCGLRLPIFVGLIVLFVIIIVAAVLGGVLGTVLSHHSSKYELLLSAK